MQHKSQWWCSYCHAAYQELPKTPKSKAKAKASASNGQPKGNNGTVGDRSGKSNRWTRANGNTNGVPADTAPQPHAPTDVLDKDATIAAIRARIGLLDKMRSSIKDCTDPDAIAYRTELDSQIQAARVQITRLKPPEEQVKVISQLLDKKLANLQRLKEARNQMARDVETAKQEVEGIRDQLRLAREAAPPPNPVQGVHIAAIQGAAANLPAQQATVFQALLAQVVQQLNLREQLEGRAPITPHMAHGTGSPLEMSVNSYEPSIACSDLTGLVSVTSAHGDKDRDTSSHTVSATFPQSDQDVHFVGETIALQDPYLAQATGQGNAADSTHAPESQVQEDLSLADVPLPVDVGPSQPVLSPDTSMMPANKRSVSETSSLEKLNKKREKLVPASHGRRTGNSRSPHRLNQKSASSTKPHPNVQTVLRFDGQLGPAQLFPKHADNGVLIPRHDPGPYPFSMEGKTPKNS